ncbi:hypothetical protein OE88DRAFT_1640016 [Heliocybe sulcata]|uniref:Uncharacterized protein n=1 Tax=Heliocybe sulcata TaxID=5364 RepID=A0A5C3MMW5_9AGAM|nr:hypothetical protein OE88DRAFT_1640016 [Heliocybe sulcata]
MDRHRFPLRRGEGTSVAELCDELFKAQDLGTVTSDCHICGSSKDVPIETLLFNCYAQAEIHADETLRLTIKHWLSSYLAPSGVYHGVWCCGQNVQTITALRKTPRFFAFSIARSNLALTRSLTLTVSKKRRLTLRGIVYFGEFHFTCRFITKSRDVYFNDGAQTGRQCILEGNLDNMDIYNLLTCRGKSASLALYMQSL